MRSAWEIVLRSKGDECPVEGFLGRQAAIAELVFDAAALDVVPAVEPLAGRRVGDGNVTEGWLPFLRGHQGKLLREDSFASVARAEHVRLHYFGMTQVEIRIESSRQVGAVQASLSP